jgi:hypothetical protein
LVLRVGIVKFLKYALNETKYACKLVAWLILQKTNPHSIWGWGGV